MYEGLYEACLKNEDNKRHTYLAVLDECLNEYNIFKNIHDHHYFYKDELNRKINKFNRYYEYYIEITDNLISFLTEINHLSISEYVSSEDIHDRTRTPYYKMYPKQLFEYLNNNENNSLLLSPKVLLINDNQRFCRHFINSIPELTSTNITYDDFINKWIKNVGDIETFKYVFNRCYNEFLFKIDIIEFAIPVIIHTYDYLNGNKDNDNSVDITNNSIYMRIYKNKIPMNNMLIQIPDNRVKYNLTSSMRNRLILSCNKSEDEINEDIEHIQDENHHLNFINLYHYCIFTNDIPTLKILLLFRDINISDGVLSHIILTPEAYRLIEQTKSKEQLRLFVENCFDYDYIDNFNNNINLENGIEPVKDVNFLMYTLPKEFKHPRLDSQILETFLLQSIRNNRYDDRVIQTLYSLFGYNRNLTYNDKLKNVYSFSKYNTLPVNMLNDYNLGKFYKSIINFSFFTGNDPIELLRYNRVIHKHEKVNDKILNEKLTNINILIEDYDLYIPSLDILTTKYLKTYNDDKYYLSERILRLNKIGYKFCDELLNDVHSVLD